MDGSSDTHAGTLMAGLSDRLRTRDPEAVRVFLRTWIDVVHGYCVIVCEPGLVVEATQVAFSDLLAKLETHFIDDVNLESALLRSTRLAAAERAMLDRGEAAAAEDHGEESSNCETTPLLLVGSPKTRAGVEVLRRMDDHIAGCPRCRATETRLKIAEESFARARAAKVSGEVLKAIEEKLSSSDEESAAGPGQVRVPGFTIISPSEGNAQGVVIYTVFDEHAGDVATLWMAPTDADPALARRLLHDARLLAEAKHPSLPRVRAVGKIREGSYLVTDELQGRSLLSVVGTGPPSARAVRMLTEIGEALDVTHRAGLLHGQIRPAHIVVGKWIVVRPVVVNFALGRIVPHDGEQAPYMSPEELRGDEPGRESDVYALGCTLFEFLTGTPPFGNSEASAHGHLNEEPPRIGEPLPSALDAVFERALAKNPEERPTSATQLVADLARALSAPSGLRRAAVASEPITMDEPAEAELADWALAGPEPPGSKPAKASHRGAGRDPHFEAAVDGIGSMMNHDEVVGASSPGPKAHGPASRDSDAEVAPQAPTLNEHEEAPLAEEGSRGAEPIPYLATAELETPESSAAGEHQRQIVTASGPAGEGLRVSARQVFLAAALAGVAVIAIVVLLAGGSSRDDQDDSQQSARVPSSERARPQVRRPPEGPKIIPGPLANAEAKDFDPGGGNGERPNEVRNIIDRNPATAWQTEPYPPGTFGRGVGAYIAMPRPQAVREVSIRTSTPGWNVEIYGASSGPPAQLPAPGWIKLGSRANMREVERIPLGRRSEPIRYCLVWVSKLPPAATAAVSIAEVSLLAGS